MCLPNRLGLLEGYNRTGPYGGILGSRFDPLCTQLGKNGEHLFEPGGVKGADRVPPAAAAAESTQRFTAPMKGTEICSLMLRHKVTIRDASARMGIAMKRIREVRTDGLDHPHSCRDWIEAITGSDPGVIPVEGNGNPVGQKYSAELFLHPHSLLTSLRIH